IVLPARPAAAAVAQAPLRAEFTHRSFGWATFSSPHPDPTAVELGWRCNARCDPLHHNPNRNPNLPMDFGSKSKSKSTIKNFAKCLNPTAVHPDPLPRGDSDRGARAPRPQFGAPSRRTSRGHRERSNTLPASQRANGEGAVGSARGGRAPHSNPRGEGELSAVFWPYPRGSWPSHCALNIGSDILPLVEEHRIAVQRHGDVT